MSYNNTDQQIHQLVQIVTKANRTFVPAKGDDSHTNLYFDGLKNRIYGRWIKNEEKRYILFLNLNDQTIDIQDKNYAIVKHVDVVGKDYKVLELDVQKALQTLSLDRLDTSNFDTTDLLQPLHFDIPDYPFKREKFKRIANADIQEWCTVRRKANQACYDLLGYLQCESEVRIWPHHFDTGIYAPINDQLGIGFGLAMQDEMVGAPYLYFSAYGLNDHTLDYAEFEPLTNGHWINNDWKGAVLPFDYFQEEQIQLFLKEVTNRIGLS